jgi:signal transduction histidine kinase
MKSPATPRRRDNDTLLVLIFGGLLASFLVAAIASQRASSEIDSLSDDIAINSGPSIQRLAELRGAVRQCELSLSLWISGRSDSEQKAELDASLQEVDRDLKGYLELPRFPGEERHWNEVQQSWVRFDEAVKLTRDIAEAGKREAAHALLEQKVDPAADRVVEAAMGAIEFNAENGRAAASRIKLLRRRSVWVGTGLTALFVILGAAGGLVIRRQAQNRRALAEAYGKTLEARAEELGQFAARVAHDIRSPVTAAALSAELILRDQPEERTRERASRAVRALARADATITGLLEFARAGAGPEPGARTDVRAVLADQCSLLVLEAEHERIALTVDPVPPVLAACSIGVYLSLSSNLVRNAIKYMGDAKVRRIRVQVRVEKGAVITEVSDTGPGIDAALVPQLFEPYFRAASGAQSGIGLGLATVKRLAEGHHGRVWVRSTPGTGSTFGFELPKAGAAWDEPVEPGAVREPELRH